MAELDPNTPDAAWVSISELARLKGLSKAAVSERVKGLVDKGQLATKPGKGKVVLVNLAAFDRAIGETTDLARAAGAETKRLTSSSARDDAAPIYTAEQARHMAYKAESARLDLEERQGKILSVADVAAAIATAGDAIARAIEQLPTMADDVAAAVAQAGASGARTALKAKARDLRDLVAKELAQALNLKSNPSEAPEDTPGD
jgi:DNA-binding Lrp family transcriptional regulator